MSTVIGIDIGRSAMKVVVFHNDVHSEFSLPSAVSAAFTLATEAAAAQAEADTVLVKNQAYFTGETALLQTSDDMLGGLSDDWITSDKHAALLLGAIKRIKAMGIGVDGAVIVVGLPARLFASQKNSYGMAVANLVPGAQVKVVPQPMGPFFALYFDATGGANPALESESRAFIEIGQFTTDFALIERGNVVERSFGSCAGMSEAASGLQRIIQERHGVSISLVEASALFINPTLRCFGGRQENVEEEVRQAVKPVAAQIADKARQLFGDRLRHMHGICLAGGGAPLVHVELPGVWPLLADCAPGYLTTIDHARFAVAEGFARFGLSVVKHRQAA